MTIEINIREESDFTWFETNINGTGLMGNQIMSVFERASDYLEDDNLRQITKFNYN